MHLNRETPVYCGGEVHVCRVESGNGGRTAKTASGVRPSITADISSKAPLLGAKTVIGVASGSVAPTAAITATACGRSFTRPTACTRDVRPAVAAASPRGVHCTSTASNEMLLANVGRIS